MAAGAGAGYLDIYAHFIRAGVAECLSPDGVHLGDRGYEVWSGALVDIIDGTGTGIGTGLGIGAV